VLLLCHLDGGRVRCPDVLVPPGVYGDAHEGPTTHSFLRVRAVAGVSSEKYIWGQSIQR
jgi:hypothetical protein